MKFKPLIILMGELVHKNFLLSKLNILIINIKLKLLIPQKLIK